VAYQLESCDPTAIYKKTKLKNGMNTVRVFAARACKPLITISSLLLYNPSHKVPKTKLWYTPVNGCFSPCQPISYRCNGIYQDQSTSHLRVRLTSCSNSQKTCLHCGCAEEDAGFRDGFAHLVYINYSFWLFSSSILLLLKYQKTSISCKCRSFSPRQKTPVEIVTTSAKIRRRTNP